jgi:hypothetical protein
MEMILEEMSLTGEEGDREAPFVVCTIKRGAENL